MKSAEEFLESADLPTKKAAYSAPVKSSGEQRRKAEALGAAAAYVNKVGLNNVTSGKLRTQLLEKKYDEDLVESVITELCESGYLNDYERALSLLSARRGHRAEGKAALRRRLHRLGVESNAAAAALAELATSEEERALEFILSKRSRDVVELRLLEDDRKAYYKLRNKILAAVCRRGFSPGVAVEALTLALQQVADD